MNATEGLDGRIALVTGASRGIGEAIARALSAAGAGVILAARSKGDLETVAAALREAGGTAWVHEVDLADPHQVADLASACAHVDVLVNSAGVAQRYLPITQQDDDYWRLVFDVDFWAPVALIRGIGAAMADRGHGVILNISSMAGLRAFPLLSHYSAAKAALDMVTRVTAMELGSAGVRTVSIAPGAVVTGHHQLADADEFLKGYSPAGVGIPPSEIGQLAVFLASDAARFVNGTVIECDGGAGAGYFHLREKFSELVQ